MTQPAEPQKPKSAHAVLHPVESMDDLATRQGIGPTEDLDALAAEWPADDDPNELEAFIRDQRAGRRSAARVKQ